MVVVDGLEGAKYDEVIKNSLIFSSDSKRIAYAAKKDEKRVALVDGHEGPKYDEAIGQGSMIFRPNGTLEYLAVKGSALYRIKHTPVHTSG